MKPTVKTSVFLERAVYRQRRLGDAARFLPVLGAVLWLVPLLWHGDSTSTQSNAGALVYIFAVWVVLIALAAVLSRVLHSTDAPSNDTPQ